MPDRSSGRHHFEEYRLKNTVEIKNGSSRIFRMAHLLLAFTKITCRLPT